MVDEDHGARAEEGVGRERDERPGGGEVCEVDEVARDREEDAREGEAVEQPEQDVYAYDRLGSEVRI